MDNLKQLSASKRLGFFNSRIALLLGVALLVVAALSLWSLLYRQTETPISTSTPPSATGRSPSDLTDNTINAMQVRVSADPNDYQAFSSLGLAYQQKARETSDPAYYTEAEKAFKQALAVEPDNYDATVGMGALNLSRHEFAQAQEWGTKATRLIPDRAYAYGVIGDAQIELGNYDQAVNTFQHMVDLRPDLSSYSRVSYARELYGDVPGAIQAMQEAINAGGPAVENTAWCHVQLGNLYFNSNDLINAEKAYNEALAIYPKYLYAQAGLAQVRWAQGRPDEAIQLYKSAVSNVPMPQYVTALGDLYKLTGDEKNAQQQYDLVAYIYDLFEKNGVNIGIEKAEFLADHDMHLATALTLAQTAGQARNDVHTQDRLAWVLYKNGQYADALKAEQNAMRLGTQNAQFYYHLGMIQSKLGQADEARKSVQKALSINPFFSPLYSAQAQAFVGGK